MSWSGAREIRFHTRDGVDLTYWFHAANEPVGQVLFLHGAASNHTRWNEFLSSTVLTKRWNVLSPDLRGHGASRTLRRLSIAQHCDDLVQLLERHPTPRLVIAGHSLGSNLALHFLARSEIAISGAVLIDPVIRPIMSHPIRRVMASSVLTVVMELVRLAQWFGIRRRTFQTLDLTLLDQHARELIKAGREDEMIRLYSSAWHDLKYFPVAVYLQDVLNVLQSLPQKLPVVPTLMLLSAGEQTDELASNRRLAGAMKRCRVVEIPCNHWIMTVAPDQARTAIEQYFSELTP